MSEPKAVVANPLRFTWTSVDGVLVLFVDGERTTTRVREWFGPQAQHSRWYVTIGSQPLRGAAHTVARVRTCRTIEQAQRVAVLAWELSESLRARS